MTMRVLLVCAIVAGPSLAQTTGGSFGSGGLGKGSGSSGTGSTGSPGRTSSGGSTSFGGSSSFGGSTRETAAESAARTARNQAAAEAARAREEAFMKAHRLAGAAELLPDEASRVQLVRVTPKPDHFSRSRADMDLWFNLIFSLVISGFAVIVLSMVLESAARPIQTLAAMLPTRPSVATYRQVMLAFDWSARPALQGALKALSEEPMTTDRERRDVVKAMTEEFQTHSRAVRYLKVREVADEADLVQAQFHRDAQSLRGRYSVETAGRLKGKADVFARPIEGNGLLVVSILMAFDKKLERRHGWMPVDAVLRLLRTSPPIQLLEVVWSPSEDNDRLSSAELEILYPELQLIGQVQIGRASCSQCGSVYALELGKCPACGSKEAERTASKATPACPYCGTAMPAHETQCRSCNAFVNRETAKA